MSIAEKMYSLKIRTVIVLPMRPGKEIPWMYLYMILSGVIYLIQGFFTWGWIIVLTNAAITIFNCFPDRETKKRLCVPHYIEHVWFHTNQKTSVVEGGLSSADEYLIRIPYSECSDWLPPSDFNELADTGEKWTVQNNDFFITGEWPGAENVSGIAEIKKEFSGEVGKVLSHSENFFGSSKHIRIGGGA